MGTLHTMKTIDFLQSSLEALGYTTQSFTLGEDAKSFTRFNSPYEGRCLTVSTNSPLYPFASSSARIIANHKDRAYDFAVQLGVSVPQSVTIKQADTSFTAARELLSSAGRVIVKPNASSVSNGLSLNIDTEAALVRAIEEARRFSHDILVQRQVVGDEIRFVVADGQVRAAILRKTPQVIGDGVHTLSELIDQENHERAHITDTAVTYPMLNDDLLDLSAFDMTAVPSKGERVELGLGTLIKTGASIYNVFESVHPSYLEVAERLGRALGPGFVVVDMMMADYTQPATEENYAFIEFNLTPALQLFYSCRDGKHFEVAKDYLAPMIETLMKGSYHD